MTIAIADDGKVILRTKFRDGSATTQELRERPGGMYEVIGSKYGDRYRIIPSSGNLQLIDDDGLIRRASRLENTPQSNEC